MYGKLIININEMSEIFQITYFSIAITRYKTGWEKRLTLFAWDSFTCC